jgi:hypothetical protein
MPLKLEHLFAGTDIPDMCHPGRNKFSRISCNTFAQVNFKNLSKSASKKKVYVRKEHTHLFQQLPEFQWNQRIPYREQHFDNDPQ